MLGRGRGELHPDGRQAGSLQVDEHAREDVAVEMQADAVGTVRCEVQLHGRLAPAELAATELHDQPGSQQVVDDVGHRGRRQPGVLEALHELAEGLLLVDPAQELPDRGEVLDVVDQRGAGQGHEQRVGGPRADPLGELQHVLGALRLLVLDVVRLVDHHPAQTQLPEPAHVPVEHLVVDDDDVREAVDRVAVPVDHRRRVVGRPQRGLPRPVHLHHVGHDDEQRVCVRGLRSQQRLCGLAQARLISEQERPVSLRGCGHHPPLVRHELQPTGRLPGGERLRQVHARDFAAVLEGPQQRLDELPAREAAGFGGELGGGGVVGCEEGVGQLAGHHRLGHHPALLDRRWLGRLRLLGGLLRHLDTGCPEELATQRPRVVGDDGVVGEQPEQGGVAGGRGGEDGGDAVEALQLLGAPGRGHRVVRLDAGALLAHQQGHHLEPGPGRGLRAASLDRGLDLADDLGHHADEAVVVGVAGSPLSARACAVRALGSLSQGLLLGVIGQTPATGPGPHRIRGGSERRPPSRNLRRPRALAGPADPHEIDASDVSSRTTHPSVLGQPGSSCLRRAGRSTSRAEQPRTS